MKNKLRTLLSIAVVAAALLLYLRGQTPGGGQTLQSTNSHTDAVSASQQAEPSSEAASEAAGQASASSQAAAAQSSAGGQSALAEDGSYTSKADVAAYLHTYGRLPGNFITKNDAKALGWDPSAGNLWDVAPGKSIGGDRFGNNEGLLPSASGRKWYECDIDYGGGTRGSRRIVFSSDGLVYYTQDHYQNFEQLY